MKSKSVVLAIAAFLVIALTSIAALADTKKSTIRVDGMKCAKCTGSVEKALKATPGVEKVEMNLERKEAVVEYDDAKVNEAKLREVINATGFKAVEEKTGSQ
ncbi:MAG TPA: heavy metal-associated domain-containing protein [Candidatus Binatia bacterium]|nr:heavy metal-associated domain-containing protein [Candidatus Binatia bacterium]